MQKAILCLIAASFLICPSSQTVCFANQPLSELQRNGKRISFDKVKWLKYQNREFMASDLIRSYSLVGMTRNKVQELLGHPWPSVVGNTAYESYALRLPASFSPQIKRKATLEVPSLQFEYEDGIVRDFKLSTCRISATMLPEGMTLPDM